MVLDKKKSNVYTFKPMMMIVPIHMGIAITGFVSINPNLNLPIVLIFCGIKTFIDIFVHGEEHNIIERTEKKEKEDKIANEKNPLYEV